MVAAATDRDELSIRINDLLRLLKTSHTRYFSVNEPRYYQLMGIFEHVVPENESEKYTYDGIGIETATIDGRHFLQSVFDGFPAAAAGMRYGDQIVRVDGLPFHPIGSFAGRAGSKVEVEIRSAVNAPLKILEVDVVAINARRMFEHAMEASVRQIEKNGRQIGYVHIWSYAGSKYHEQLKQLIFWGPLANCDGLVVDLRDGWGGASPDYVNVFREPIASLESRGRSTEPANYTGVWGKPVVLLVNERTTSGKELFAYVFKKLRLGTVVGSKSAGAVAGGRLFSLNNGDALYLAIAELKIDGQLLEGVGVAPDVIISRPLEFANGADPQLDAALEQFK
jgi:carboxyl-terminal processing protease